MNLIYDSIVSILENPYYSQRSRHVKRIQQSYSVCDLTADKNGGQVFS